MRMIYLIFSVTGWIWAAVVFSLLYIRRRRLARRGFGVVMEEHEKQS